VWEVQEGVLVLNELLGDALGRVKIVEAEATVSTAMLAAICREAKCPVTDGTRVMHAVEAALATPSMDTEQLNFVLDLYVLRCGALVRTITLPRTVVSTVSLGCVSVWRSARDLAWFRVVVMHPDGGAFRRLFALEDIVSPKFLEVVIRCTCHTCRGRGCVFSPSTGVAVPADSQVDPALAQQVVLALVCALHRNAARP
jgi:hypothetical protein